MASNSQSTNRVDSGTLVALVTAGSKRLGRLISLRLAELGYDIALHYNSSKDEAEVTAREIQTLGRKCGIFKRNFEHIDEVLTLIPEIRETMGNPSLLINNASVFSKNSLIDSMPEDFDVDMNVQVKAPFFLMRDLAKACERGQAINIVDTGVNKFKTDYFTYLLAKKSLWALTQIAAAELAPRIRVNAIAPGLIIAPYGLDRNQVDRASTANPLHRAGSPDDVVVAMEYLLKNEHVTGECLYVDGGEGIDY